MDSGGPETPGPARASGVLGSFWAGRAIIEKCVCDPAEYSTDCMIVTQYGGRHTRKDRRTFGSGPQSPRRPRFLRPSARYVIGVDLWRPFHRFFPYGRLLQSDLPPIVGTVGGLVVGVGCFVVTSVSSALVMVSPPGTPGRAHSTTVLTPVSTPPSRSATSWSVSSLVLLEHGIEQTRDVVFTRVVTSGPV